MFYDVVMLFLLCFMMFKSVLDVFYYVLRWHIELNDFEALKSGRRDSATRTTKLRNLSSRVPPPRPITLSPVLSSSHWAGLGKKFRRAERKYFLRKSTERVLSPERGLRRSSSTRTSCWPHTKCMVIPVKLCITCMGRKDQIIPINILARLKKIDGFIVMSENDGKVPHNLHERPPEIKSSKSPIQKTRFIWENLEGPPWSLSRTGPCRGISSSLEQESKDPKILNTFLGRPEQDISAFLLITTARKPPQSG